MDGVDQEVLAIFREEVTGCVEALAEILELLRAADEAGRIESTATARRIAHNLKGAARLAGVARVEALAHSMEDALGAAHHAGDEPSESLVDALESALPLIQLAAEGSDVGRQIDAIAGQLAAFDQCGTDTGRETRGTLDSALAPDRDPTPPETQPVYTPGAAPLRLRVEIGRLDQLAKHVAELLVVRTRWQERSGFVDALAQQLRRDIGGGSTQGLRKVARALEEMAERERREQLDFTHLTDSLTRAMRRVRMLPLHSQVTAWQRIVHDCAQELGKEVVLEVQVGEVEIDKSILDKLRDPLMHLLRNAVDHGIEPQVERLASGKPEHGQITVRASTRGAIVQIEVADDGRGLDTEKIARQALALGLATSETLSGMSADEVRALVFEPGLSTAGVVSRVSGRGVGLDVVHRSIIALGGTVQVLGNGSQPGMRMALEVPATLVSSRGLLVEAGGAVYALPIDAVVRTLRVPPESIRQVDGSAAVGLDGGEVVALRSLSTLMGRPRTAQPGFLPVVVIAHAKMRLALVVDQVLGEAEFVSQPLPWNLPQLPGVSGAALLGDGRVAVVADPARIVAESSDRASELFQEAAAAQASRRVPKVLVVDDSLTSRTLERNILKAAGYEVVVAIDGEEAWEDLQEGSVDVVVSDVDMPRLDGLALTRRIRSHNALAKTPVILVTSLERQDQLAEGAAAGADEYIVKGRFDQRDLLEAVARLV